MLQLRSQGIFSTLTLFAWSVWIRARRIGEREFQFSTKHRQVHGVIFHDSSLSKTDLEERMERSLTLGVIVRLFYPRNVFARRHSPIRKGNLPSDARLSLESYLYAIKWRGTVVLNRGPFPLIR